MSDTGLATHQAPPRDSAAALFALGAVLLWALVVPAWLVAEVSLTAEPASPDFFGFSHFLVFMLLPAAIGSTAAAWSNAAAPLRDRIELKRVWRIGQGLLGAALLVPLIWALLTGPAVHGDPQALPRGLPMSFFDSRLNLILPMDGLAAIVGLYLLGARRIGRRTMFFIWGCGLLVLYLAPLERGAGLIGMLFPREGPREAPLIIIAIAMFSVVVGVVLLLSAGPRRGSPGH